MPRNAIHFDLPAEFQAAFDYCWAHPWYNQPWVTATDLVRRTRAQLLAKLEGRDVGDNMDTYLSGLRVRGVRDMLGEARRWLLAKVDAGVLDARDPSGRGTISGMRFRPAGAPLTEAEIKTSSINREERNRRRWICHLKGANGKPACQASKAAKRSFYSTYRRRPVSVTENTAHVTCKKCQKLTAKTATPTNL